MLQVSEAIRFEDEEEAQGERDFSEIQEQVYEHFPNTLQEHDNLLMPGIFCLFCYLHNKVVYKQMLFVVVCSESVSRRQRHCD